MIFKKKKKLGTIDTLIDRDNIIKGNYSYSGGIRLDGKIYGDLTVVETSAKKISSNAESRGLLFDRAKSSFSDEMVFIFLSLSERNSDFKRSFNACTSRRIASFSNLVSLPMKLIFTILLQLFQ